MIDQTTALRAMVKRQNEKKAKIVAVASGKGGTGKSNFALNMAIELSRRNMKVLVIDADFGFCNIDVILGITTKYNLMHVLNGEKEIHEIIERGTQGIQFISGGSGVYDLTRLNSYQLNRLISGFKTLENIADIIIFDTGAGIDDNIIKLIHASHETVLVTTPEPTAIMDAYAMVKIASYQNEKPNIRLVLNMAENDKEANAAMDGFITMAKKYIGIDIEKLGYISKDECVAKAVKMQIPLMVSFPKSKAAMDIKKLMAVYLKIEDQKTHSIFSFFSRLSANNLHRRGSCH